jgi:DNA-binding Xre family transcriptional regulator
MNTNEPQEGTTTTLKDLWEIDELTPTECAAKAGISVATLYKMNRKEHVSSSTVGSVCRVLGISRDVYALLAKGKGKE